MAEVKRAVVNGVNTINLHGKNYVEVAERVRLVHDQKREFEVVESAPLAVGDRCLWRVVIKVDGRQYVGNAEAKLNARPGSPDATNPFECAETSALGRALAFAGFGSVESIASFDEVYRATTSGAPIVESAPETATEQQLASIRKLCERLGKEAPEGNLSFAEAKQWIAGLTEEYKKQQDGPERVSPTQSGNLIALIKKAKSRAFALGLAKNAEEWVAFLHEATGESLRDEALTVAHIGKLNGKLTEMEKSRKEGAA